MSKHDKKTRGQFYTDKCAYILDGLVVPTSSMNSIIEPFAGKGDLLNWVDTQSVFPKPDIFAYDIEPKKEGIIERDTLLFPPDYKDAFIITNPPYLARNKCADKTVFDKYNTNDLYKCFITSLTQQDECAAGGIFIIPAGFFFSPRDLDVRCRNDFLSKYKLICVKYFEESVFDDTSTTVVAFSFEKSPTVLTEQNVEWICSPSGKKQIFNMSTSNDWIIGGDIYKLSTPPNIVIRRYVVGRKLKENEHQTFMTLCALDSGTQDGRISLTFRENYIYQAKECSRTYATLCIQGKNLSFEEQKNICCRFNELLEKKRTDTWSLFLPQFRESKEYARKRIPFELAYTIVLHLLQT
jgi:hypothetical protein